MFGVVVLLSVLLAVAILYLGRKSSERSQNVSTLSKSPDSKASRSVAVIVPTLQETSVLPKTINRLFSRASTSSKDNSPHVAASITVVVVDASPTSATRECLDPLMTTQPSLHLVHYPGKPSRGAQMNFGAAHAIKLAPETSTFVFLHADTHLPFEWNDAICTLLSSTQVPTLGCFKLSLSPPISLGLQTMLWCANQRAKWGGLPYGDQCYFLSRATYDTVHGFPSVPIMEDLGMLRRISRIGQVVVLDAVVETNSRRWNRKGVLWNTVLNQILVAAWLCGASHESIYRWYYGRDVSG